jgi:hypothetical protein
MITIKAISDDSNYFVCSNGQILGKYGFLYLKRDREGYQTVRLCSNGKFSYPKVHRLVASAFIPNPEGKSEVNHIDGNKSNNNVDNLEWCTKSENMKHAYKLGLRKNKGDNSPRHKLTENDIRAIRSMLNESIKQSVIAERFGVAPNTISCIKGGSRWKDVN